MEENLPVEQKRLFRFIHSSLAIISLIWIAVCLLIYFHAPSYLLQQVFDCRWYLSALIIQAVFGHIFIFISQTTFLFVAAFISTQYAVVYSMLCMVIYGMDTILLMVSSRPTILNYVPYLKLTAVLIVLSGFGLALSLLHLYRLFKIGRILGTSNTSFGNVISFQVSTGAQIILALFSVYVVASLVPLKFWYVRVHLVQEFSCSLLATILAFMQFVVFRNVICSGQLLIRAIVLANCCQMVQELNMALSAFYTLFYVDRIYDAVEGRTEMLGLHDPHIQLAMARGQRAKTMLFLNLLMHISRMMINLFIAFKLATKVFEIPLMLRIKFKIDSELVNAEENWKKIKRKEQKWLYSICICVLATGIGNLLLNFGYIWASMIFESLSVATGLSFVFSMALIISIGFYTWKILRFFLILSAYISLNLLITASLLLFSFFQDFFFLATALDNDDEDELFKFNSSDVGNGTSMANGVNENEEMDMGASSSLRVLLYFADFGLSLGTFLIAGFTIRYAIRTLIKTKVMQIQPPRVTRAIRILRALALAGIVSSAIEIFMLAELRLGSRGKISTHSSINTSFYDWLLSSSQFVFLFYITKFERYQALLPVQIMQLASVSVTALDLIGQQTETVQVYVNNVLQFYRLTEALVRGASDDSGSSNTVFISQPMAFTVPLHLFVDILALHFIQIIQWFLTIAALSIALYAFDNMQENELDQINDFHELRGNDHRTVVGQTINGPAGNTNTTKENQTELAPQDPTSSTSTGKTFGQLNINKNNKMAFDNQVFGDEGKIDEQITTTG